MTGRNSSVSQRLLRKGAFVEETYQLFRGWEDDLSFDANFDRAFSGNFRTDAWANEVRATLRPRFKDISAARPLITLARGEYPIADWRYCLLLEIASREVLYRDFAIGWLYPEYSSGRYQLRADDALGYVLTAWEGYRVGKRGLTDYGAVRTARDLLRMARDLGVLEGTGSAKTFATVHLSDDLVVYVCHVIAEQEGSTSRVPGSDLWKVFLLGQDQVHGLLLHLHQFRKLEYEIAGSLVQLTLPCSSAREYAERMVV